MVVYKKNTQQQHNTINLNTCKAMSALYQAYSTAKISTALGKCKYCFRLRKTNELNTS